MTLFYYTGNNDDNYEVSIAVPAVAVLVVVLLIPVLCVIIRRKGLQTCVILKKSTKSSDKTDVSHFKKCIYFRYAVEPH